MSNEVNETKESKAYKEWYANNKAKISKARRAKYKADPEYREAIVSRQKEYRANNPPPSRAGTPSYRLVAGKKREVFRIGAVAEMIDRTDQTIRDWEEKGLIPKPSIVSSHRYYTKHQVALLKQLADIISLLRSTDRKDFDVVVAVKSKEVHSNWNN